MVTVIDVAREAQVSPSTVSLVNNGNGYVSDATRDRVKRAIKKLGYQPRPPVRSVRKNQKKDLAVIYSPIGPTSGDMSSIALEMVKGIQLAIDRMDVRSSFVAAAPHLDQDLFFQENLGAGRFAGAILVGFNPSNDSYIDGILDARIPLVTINRDQKNPFIASVSADFEQAGYLAAERLLQLGHRCIAFVGTDAQHWPTAQRYAGHQRALAACGVAEGMAFFTDSTNKSSKGSQLQQFCCEAIESGHTAFASGTLGASTLVVHEELARLGVRVPGDVSLVGLDGRGMCLPGSDLRMTCVDYDKQYLGELAVATLMELIGAEGRICHITKKVTPEFIEGDTHAPVANQAKPSQT